MSEATTFREQSHEQGTSPTKEAILQFSDRALAIRLTGDNDVTWDLNDEAHKYNPARGNEAIIGDTNGGQYYLVHDTNGGSYIVDLNATRRRGTLVGAYKPPEEVPAYPLVEFGKPWQVGPIKTGPVGAILLKYKSAAADYPGSLQVSSPSPFSASKELVGSIRRNSFS